MIKHGGKFDCYICEGVCDVESGTLRTFGSLTSHYEAYTAAGSNPKIMQNYKNVIRECLVKADPEQLVGDLLRLPELHLLIGTVNHLYKLLERVWPHISIWGQGKWTVHGQQGSGLNGANSNRFLQKIADLRKAAPPITYPILNTLQKFQYITTRCLGWELCSDYKKRI